MTERLIDKAAFPLTDSTIKHVCSKFFAQALGQERWFFVVSQTPAVHVPLTIGDNYTRTAHVRDSDGEELVIFLSPEADILVRLANRKVYVTVAAGSQETAERINKECLASFTPPKRAPNDRAGFRFWSWTSSGYANERYRELLVPKWDDIKGNYSTGVAANLDQLISYKPNAESAGKLLIIHGPPGCAKTYFVRSLCREWKDWMSAQYIVDPEAFFGSAEYMLSVLLKDNEDDEEEYPIIPSVGDPVPFPVSSRWPSDDKSWRLVIVEDADEFLRCDAKQRSGQALGRLLNLCDGLVGQGLRILVLLTTNERLSDLHPAVTRAGRCIANIEFGSLNYDEANKWRADHGITGVSGESTIADLYAELNNSQPVKTTKKERVNGQYV